LINTKPMGLGWDDRNLKTSSQQLLLQSQPIHDISRWKAYSNHRSLARDWCNWLRIKGIQQNLLASLR
jgi:hypothetical protein